MANLLGDGRIAPCIMEGTDAVNKILELLLDCRDISEEDVVYMIEQRQKELEQEPSENVEELHNGPC